MADQAMNRNELFSQHATPKLRRRRVEKKSTESNTDDSSAIRDSLLRTRAMLSSEVDRIGATQATLEEDARVMSKTAEDYGVLGDLSSNARKVLRSLENAKMKEQVLLYCATGFYTLCLIYVIYTRLQGFVLFFTGLIGW
mmetsp:Transcript_6004/g.12024  ORF Transcript_6004/g.12024 Transcript_6004/m.12024 type:complete len:140 (-) Transcript_6004:49-468(-)